MSQKSIVVLLRVHVVYNRHKIFDSSITTLPSSIQSGSLPKMLKQVLETNQGHYINIKITHRSVQQRASSRYLKHKICVDEILISIGNHLQDNFVSSRNIQWKIVITCYINAGMLPPSEPVHSIQACQQLAYSALQDNHLPSD